MPVTLIRHTTPDIADGICYGSTDLDVAASFSQEADQVLTALESCDQLISSPLRRCHKLAAEIGKHFKVDIAVDERLREMDFGHWEGRAWSDICETEVGAWTKDFLHARPHGGESVNMLRQRARAALAAYAQAANRVVFVTHSGIIKSLLATGDTAADFQTEIEFGGIVHLDARRNLT